MREGAGPDNTVKTAVACQRVTLSEGAEDAEYECGGGPLRVAGSSCNTAGGWIYYRDMCVY